MARLSRLERTIAGKVTLVIGGASGMGRATAHLFADEGARVAVIDRDADGARRVAQEIASVGGSAYAWDLDVSDETRIAATVAGVVDRYGGLDILIHNAGVSGRVPVEAEGYGALWVRTGGARTDLKGSWTVMVVPRPGSLVTSSWPPWLLTMPRLTDMPSPVPWPSGLVV
jgi:NAD(P)-dependent dehydrogenase (short-subunit alcohol dehydrogenase family)